MYISSAPVKDLEIRICFEPDRFPFAMGFSGSPLIEFPFKSTDVHIHIKLYTVIAFLSAQIHFNHISPQKCACSFAQEVFGLEHHTHYMLNVTCVAVFCFV